MKNHFSLLTIIYGIIFISFIIWNRIIRVRQDLDIADINSNIKIFFVCFNMIIFIYLLYNNVLQILGIEKLKSLFIENLLEKKIVKLLINFLQILIESPKAILTFIYDKINIRNFIEYYGAYLTMFLEKHPFRYYVLFFTLPRIIITLTLFIDIVIFNQIKYINIIIYIGLIPLILRVTLYIIEYFAQRTITYLEQFFSIRYQEDINKILHLFYDYTEVINEAHMKIQRESNKEYVTNLYYIHNENLKAINDFYNSFTAYKLYFNSFILLVLIIIFTIQLGILLHIDYYLFVVSCINNEEPFSGLYL